MTGEINNYSATKAVNSSRTAASDRGTSVFDDRCLLEMYQPCLLSLEMTITGVPALAFKPQKSLCAVIVNKEVARVRTPFF